MVSKEIKEIMKMLESHNRRILALEGKNPKLKKTKDTTWYKPDSTIAKIVGLIQQGFFKQPKNMTEIIMKLKTKDYHLKSSDLTLPLRKIVRKGLLEKTKEVSGGKMSKIWVYINV